MEVGNELGLIMVRQFGATSYTGVSGFETAGELVDELLDMDEKEVVEDT